MTLTPTTGIGSETVMVQVSMNAGQERTAYITFAGVSDEHDTVVLPITQEAPYLMCDTNEVNLLSSTDFTSVTISSNTAWSASTNVNWCTVTPSIDDDTQSHPFNKLLIFVKENRGQERSCVITAVTCEGNVSPVYIYVNQEESQGAKIDPPNVYLMSASKTGLTFGWDEVEGADSYDIYFDLTENIDNGEKPTRIMDSYTGTALTITSLTSYIANTNDSRVDVGSGGKILGYTPEDS